MQKFFLSLRKKKSANKIFFLSLRKKSANKFFGIFLGGMVPYDELLWNFLGVYGTANNNAEIGKFTIGGHLQFGSLGW